MVWYLIEHRIQNDDVKILNVLMSGITDKMNDKPHDKSNMDATCLSSFNILTVSHLQELERVEESNIGRLRRFILIEVCRKIISLDNLLIVSQ